MLIITYYMNLLNSKYMFQNIQYTFASYSFLRNLNFFIYFVLFDSLSDFA